MARRGSRTRGSRGSGGPASTPASSSRPATSSTPAVRNNNDKGIYEFTQRAMDEFISNTFETLKNGLLNDKQRYEDEFFVGQQVDDYTFHFDFKTRVYELLQRVLNDDQIDLLNRTMINVDGESKSFIDWIEYYSSEFKEGLRYNGYNIDNRVLNKIFQIIKTGLNSIYTVRRTEKDVRVQEVTNDLQVSERANSVLEGENTRLETENTDLTAQNEALEKQLKDLRERNQRFEGDNRDLRSRNTRLEAEKLDLTSNKRSLERDVQDLTQRNTELTRTGAELQRKIVNSEISTVRNEAEIDELKKRSGRLETKNERLLDEEQDRILRINELRDINDALRQENTILAKKVAGDRRSVEKVMEILSKASENLPENGNDLKLVMDLLASVNEEGDNSSQASSSTSSQDSTDKPRLQVILQEGGGQGNILSDIPDEDESRKRKRRRKKV